MNAMSAASKTPRPGKASSKAPAKTVRGRPTKYRAEFAEQARRLALLGQTDVEMAAFFGVAERTLHYWKGAHRDFLQPLKAGKEEADALVAESLYRAAIGGGTITETKVQADADGNIVGRTTEIKQLPANTTAMIFWLKNRQPDKWRDRIEHQADINVDGPGMDELARVFHDRMQQAQERQARTLAERGFLSRGDSNEG